MWAGLPILHSIVTTILLFLNVEDTIFCKNGVLFEETKPTFENIWGAEKRTSLISARDDNYHNSKSEVSVDESKDI